MLIILTTDLCFLRFLRHYITTYSLLTLRPGLHAFSCYRPASGAREAQRSTAHQNGRTRQWRPAAFIRPIHPGYSSAGRSSHDSHRRCGRGVRPACPPCSALLPQQSQLPPQILRRIVAPQQSLLGAFARLFHVPATQLNAGRHAEQPSCPALAPGFDNRVPESTSRGPRSAC